jgi:glyoxylase-like metal-dependent hydrolase (beta-lactamase superfamily II)
MGIAARELKKNIISSTVILVNTHFHRDHVEGNSLYAKAHLIAGAYTPQQWLKGAGKARYPDEIIRPNEEKILRIGTEIVHVRNMGPAHTTNDVVVYCEHRKLLMTGDLVFLGNHPVLYTKSGCNVASWINVIDSVYRRYDISTLVPGHGRITDRSGLLTMKDYFVSIGQSIGSPEKQLELKKKYKDYFSIPGMSSFEKTLGFIEKERGKNGQTERATETR